MTETREILGLWWLPEKPEERWVGTLTSDDDKSPRLTVTVPNGFQEHESAPPVVYGHDQHGKPITLLFPGLPRSRGGMAISQLEFSAGFQICVLSDMGIPSDRFPRLRQQLATYSIDYV
jgi:hypothetical protein